METNESNLLPPEESLDTVEHTAIIEEQESADWVYGCLDMELQKEKSNLPNPDVGPYTTDGYDYDDIVNLQYKKAQNAPFWKRIDALSGYCNDGSLYIGHMRNRDDQEYFVMDNPQLVSRLLDTPGYKVRLVNADDKQYAGVLSSWRFPTSGSSVALSRMVSLRQKNVVSVDVLMDRRGGSAGELSDRFLKEALCRNKNKAEIGSIIQTIQEKQDYIRQLPVKQSFIVQGCAGSGKTMVLLHRLRYLIFNKELYSEDYVVIGPGNAFREYLKNICGQFRIKYDNVLSLQQYYQKLMGKTAIDDTEDVSELVFPEYYLNRVYSKGFIQDSYEKLFNFIKEKMNDLASSCEEKFNNLYSDELMRLQGLQDSIRSEVYAFVKCSTQDFSASVPVPFPSEYDNLDVFLAVAEELLAEYREKYESAATEQLIEISDTDERITESPALVTLQEEITAAEAALKKASFFTANAHRNKLKKLQGQYHALLQSIKEQLMAEEREKQQAALTEILKVFGGLKLDDVESVLGQCHTRITDAESQLKQINLQLENIEENLSNEYAEALSCLGSLIEATPDLDEDAAKIVDNLDPGYACISKYIQLGTKVKNLFGEFYLSEREYARFADQFRIFAERTPAQEQAYMDRLLFGIIKRALKEELGYQPSKQYKHYWYLALFSRYLTRQERIDHRTSIFIDETQDLSLTELNLIRAYNTVEGTAPVLNLFGDVNQMISQHGISRWDSIPWVSKVFHLDENFRNTNQIVEFCCNELPFPMTAVGVDANEVAIFETVHASCLDAPGLLNNMDIVVKDSIVREDMLRELTYSGVKNARIHTVKEVKGLEFRKVAVVERDMTDNERYIAYTRALVELIIIGDVQRYTKITSSSLIIQDNDLDEEDD